MFQLFTANLALLTAFMFLSSRLLRNYERKPLMPVKLRLVIGGVHGLFGILLMFFSVRIDGSTILDFRQIAIIAAAHFGGIYASVVTGVIIAAGRIAMFGVNQSSLTAATTAMLLGLISGIIAARVTDYWKKWLLSIAAGIGIITSSLFFLLGWQSWKVNLYFVAIIFRRSVRRVPDSLFVRCQPSRLSIGGKRSQLPAVVYAAGGDFPLGDRGCDYFHGPGRHR
ncbi:LytS/YhcK type 5TM receptor domain-containing protein [Paenibacillus ehimensis]|uniref:LytS/YhcK type 5TM receptor domain-containing protein n=1 Tax=Paenibacillus ehimensis TaxID=79264 RepID=UPI000559DD03|nr:LytS/YhcK type 5TM receptor domain-containing protein [Paenibacillus ehimensis]